MKKYILLAILICLSSSAFALTIAEQLTAVNLCRTDIRDSIISKGVAVPSDTAFGDYDDKIDSIAGGLTINNMKELAGASCTETIAADDMVIVKQTWATIANDASSRVYMSGRDIAMSNDGDYVAIVKNSNISPAYLQSWKWNGTTLRYESTSNPDIVPSTGSAYCAAMSDDGQYLAMSHSASPYISTYKWNSGNDRYEKTADVDTLPPGASFGVSMSNDGTRIVVCYQTSPYFSTYTWNSGNNRYEIETTADTIPTSYPNNIVISGTNGDYLALTGGSPHYLTSYKWNTGNSRYEITNYPDVGVPLSSTFGNGLAMSDDGSRLIFAGSQGTVTTYQWDATGTQYDKDTNQPDLDTVTNRIGHIRVANDGLTLFVSYEFDSSNDEPINPVILKWNSSDSKYVVAPYPDTLPSVTEDMWSIAVNGAVDRFVVAGENYIYTYNLPDTYTTKVSKINNSTNYTVPLYNDRYDWMLMGTAQDAGNSGDSIGVNSFIYFTEDAASYITTP